MFVVDLTSLNVNEYALTAAFDVSTSSFAGSFSAGAQGIIPFDMTFSNDGKKMFVLGHNGNDVNGYTLTKPFDLSSASFDRSFSVASEDQLLRSLAFSGDGTKMFVAGSTNDSIYQYALSKPFTLYPQPNSLASFEAAPVTNNIPPDNAPPTVSSIATADTSTINIVLSEDVTINGAAPEDFVLSGTISTDPAVTGITAAANNTVALALDDTLDSNDVILLAYTKTTGSIDDIPLPPLDGSFPVDLQDSESTGVAFSGDGTRMFVAGSDNDSIYQYALATAFDVSTASYNDKSFPSGITGYMPRDRPGLLR